jgi:hypothetical protein
MCACVCLFVCLFVCVCGGGWECPSVSFVYQLLSAVPVPAAVGRPVSFTVLSPIVLPAPPADPLVPLDVRAVRRDPACAPVSQSYTRTHSCTGPAPVCVCALSLCVCMHVCMHACVYVSLCVYVCAIQLPAASLLGALSLDHVLTLFRCVLAERRVLFIAGDPQRATEAAELLTEVRRRAWHRRRSPHLHVHVCVCMSACM